MNTAKIPPRFIFITSAIFVAALLRLLPHWPNFTPVAAMALFGGAYLNRKWMAFVIPVSAMLIADLIIGFHSYMLAVYLSFALIVIIGVRLKKRIRTSNVLLASVCSSILFFIITNLAVWYGSPFYSQDIQGLTRCFALAIPFFNNGILGDLFYSGVLFGGFYLAQLRFPVLAKP